MVMFMSRPPLHPIVFDSLAVMLSASLVNSFSIDEQAVIGAFLSVLGDLISFHSTYLSLVQTQNQQEDSYEDKDDSSDEYELIKKSIDKLQEEIEKLKH